MPTIPDFTVGNTITVAVAVYKNNLKKFFKLSLIAHLWLLVPIYGWARYFAIAAWISRLSFDELTDKINNPNKKQYFSTYSLFVFLVSGLISVIAPIVLGYLMTALIFMFVGAVIQIATTVFSGLEYDIFDPSNATYPLIATISCFLLSLFSSWFYTNIFVSDLIFINANKGKILYLIAESQKIAKNREVEIFKTIWLSFLVSLPVWIGGFLVYIFLCIVMGIVSAILADVISANEELVLSLCLFTGLFCAHLVLVPFWQSVKAVTFYQLTNLERKYSLR